MDPALRLPPVCGETPSAVATSRWSPDSHFDYRPPPESHFCWERPDSIIVQSMRNEESLLDHAVGADLPVTVGMPGVRPARSDQLSAQVDARLTPNMILTLNGYARRFGYVLTPAAITSTPYASQITSARVGRCARVELETVYQHKSLSLRADLGIAGVLLGGPGARDSPRRCPKPVAAVGESADWADLHSLDSVRV